MRYILVIQATYYLLTGLWPLVSIRTFEAVTGPKTDHWLVYMVGLLAAVIGTSLLLGLGNQPPRAATIGLAILAAVSFAAIDAIFSLNGTISLIYLVDALVQAIFIAALGGGLLFIRQ